MVPDRQFSDSSRNDSGIAARLRVVVVDDEPDTVLTLLALLRDQGYDAEGFASGQAALDAMDKIDPDVIISDIAMPTPNGWDLARAVRAAYANSPRPLMIAISGMYRQAADQMLGRLGGFNYYLVKPCDPSVLFALLRRM